MGVAWYAKRNVGILNDWDLLLPGPDLKIFPRKLANEFLGTPLWTIYSTLSHKNIEFEKKNGTIIDKKIEKLTNRALFTTILLVI